MMKHIFLACSFALVAAAPVSAQTAASTQSETQTAQADAKRIFISKSNELGAAVSRNVPEAVKKITSELMDLMQQDMRATRERVNSASGDAKAKLENTYQNQLKIYIDVKGMVSDVKGNYGAISDKLRAFQNTL